MDSVQGLRGRIEQRKMRKVPVRLLDLALAFYLVEQSQFWRAALPSRLGPQLPWPGPQDFAACGLEIQVQV